MRYILGDLAFGALGGFVVAALMLLVLMASGVAVTPTIGGGVFVALIGLFCLLGMGPRSNRDC